MMRIAIVIGSTRPGRRADAVARWVHAHAWSAKIASFDGFVFVTPEYNHGTSAALKNAIDYLFAERHNKAAGFVGYGDLGGIRALAPLRVPERPRA